MRMIFGRSLGIMLMLFLLVLFPMFQLSPWQSGSPSVANAASSSCPSNSILKMTMFGGTPNTFNLLSASTQSAFLTLKMMYWGVYPPPSVTGALDWNDSITDWVTSNANYTHWTFNVRPGLMWSNGQPVTSQDILNTYSKSYGLNATVDFVNAHTEVVQENKLNSSAVEFVLNQSDAHFPEKISDLIYTPVMPASFVSQGPSYNGFGTTDVSVGPFYVANYSASSTSAVLLRNPYFKPEPKICEIQMNYVETDSQVATYLSSGSTDLAPVEPSSVASILKNPNIHLIDEKGIWLQAIDYNVSVYPYNMTAFRQALAYGINQNQIVQQAWVGYAQSAISAQGGVPQVSTGWYNPNQPSYNYNPTTSLSLLSTIGIKKGSDGFLQYPNGTDVTLTLWYDNTFTSDTLTAGMIQSELQSLGFKINLVSASLSTIVGDTYGNVNNINNAMIMQVSTGAVFGLPYLDALPNYEVDMLLAPYPGWEGDPIGQAQYQSNLTALEATANQTLERNYLNNIQALNAKYLPALNIAYPDSLWGYNTQHWTNWPNSLTTWDWRFNATTLAVLTPVGQSSSTTTSSASPSISQTQSASSSISSTSSSISTTSSSSSSNKTANNSSILVVLAIVSVLIVIGGAAILMRRSKPRPTTR